MVISKKNQYLQNTPLSIKRILGRTNNEYDKLIIIEFK